MKKELIQNVLQSIENKSGVPKHPYAAWASLSIVYSLFSIIRLPSVFSFAANAAILAAHAALVFLFFRWSKDDKNLSVMAFAAFKKAINYFAFVQFCLGSIILILAWSKESISTAEYNVFYWFMLFINAIYILVFIKLNSKKNLADKGYLLAKKEGTKTVYVPVKFFSDTNEENRRDASGGKGKEQKQETDNKPARKALMRTGLFVFSWVDAIIWAVSTVIFVNSLFFQLFQIPSESMVPELYVGTRVGAIRFLTNPEIPLSNMRIPVTFGVKRYGQYVLSNPRYVLKKDQAINDFVNDFLFKVSFTLIRRPKVDENGVEIADPLIKRLIGMPGEPLMMIDDTVYVRNSLDGTFEVLKGDEKTAYNFKNRIPANMQRIRYNVVTESRRTVMLQWDELKNSMSGAGYGDKARQYADFFASVRLRMEYSGAYDDTYGFLFNTYQKIDERFFDAYASVLKKNPSLFRSNLKDYLFGWETAVPPENLYEESALKTDLMSKLLFCEALKQYILMTEAGLSEAEAYKKSVDNLQDFNFVYIQQFFDARNFAPFPENGLLPKGEYFFMGDNRYNSLDCRHWSMMSEDKLLYGKDPYSLRYSSNLHPFSINKDRIRAIAVFSFM